MWEKELEKLFLTTSKPDHQLPDLHKMKARIKIVCDFEDLKNISSFSKDASPISDNAQVGDGDIMGSCLLLLS
jgi:hypothetical protein